MNDQSRASRNRSSHRSAGARSFAWRRTVIWMGWLILGGAAAIVANGWPVASSPRHAHSVLEANSGIMHQESTLRADHSMHDFGDVSIGGGTVQASFELTNTGPDAVEIISVYTSCMYTTATLGFPDGTREGPFGMPGHELPIALERVLAGGQLATVTVSTRRPMALTPSVPSRERWPCAPQEALSRSSHCWRTWLRIDHWRCRRESTQRGDFKGSSPALTSFLRSPPSTRQEE